MAQFMLKAPRVGKEEKKALFQADATVTLVGIKPSTRGGLAVLQWTNPSGGGGRRRPALQPAAMQCALHYLPCAGDGTVRWVWRCLHNGQPVLR